MGLVCMAGVVWKCVTETNYAKEENVVPPVEGKERGEGEIE